GTTDSAAESIGHTRGRKGVRRMTRRTTWLGSGIGTALVAAWFSVAGAEEPRDRGGLHEPVYRAAKATPTTAPAAVREAHPLDPAIDLAKQVRDNLYTNVRDYTCTVVKRENIDGKVNEHEFMFCK